MTHRRWVLFQSLCIILAAGSLIASWMIKGELEILDWMVAAVIAFGPLIEGQEHSRNLFRQLVLFFFPLVVEIVAIYYGKDMPQIYWIILLIMIMVYIPIQYRAAKIIIGVIRDRRQGVI